MVKELDEKDSKKIQRNMFYINEKYYELIDKYKDSRKKKNKESNFLKYGYDFVKLSAGLAKRKKYKPKPLDNVNDKVKLFEKGEFANNPDIDLVFQIIAYSEMIDKYKNDEIESKDTYKIIANKAKCREIAESFSNSGYNFIEKLFSEADFDPLMINLEMVSKLIDIDEEIR